MIRGVLVEYIISTLPGMGLGEESGWNGIKKRDLAEMAWEELNGFFPFPVYESDQM